MLTLYLIRHGMKESFIGNPPLSALGVKQAEMTAQYLKAIPFVAIYASPMKRTQETATILAHMLQLPVHTDTRLVERLEWELETGETLEDFMEEWRKTQLDRDYAPKHGNTSRKTGEDMQAVFEDIADRYTEGNIIIVSHGGAIEDVLRNLFKDDILPLQKEPLHQSMFIKIWECSITKIALSDGQYKLLEVGNTDHLLEPVM